MESEHKAYEVTARREPGWWIIEVPEIDVTTQACRLHEVEANAREAIGVWLDVDPEAVTVHVTRENPQAVDLFGEARQLAADAAQLQHEAAERSLAAISELVEGLKLSLREVGELTGLSHQRIAQLVQKASEDGARLKRIVEDQDPPPLRVRQGAVQGELRTREGAVVVRIGLNASTSRSLSTHNESLSCAWFGPLVESDVDVVPRSPARSRDRA